MNKTLVIVWIPAYNHEKFVVNVIQSIIDQSYYNIDWYLNKYASIQ